MSRYGESAQLTLMCRGNISGESEPVFGKRDANDRYTQAHTALKLHTLKYCKSRGGRRYRGGERTVGQNITTVQ